MSRGNCYLDRAPNADWVVTSCPEPFPLRGGACRKLELCVGVSDEGCCEGCESPMSTRIAKRCVRAIEAATTCLEVVRAKQQNGCVR